MEDPNAMSDIPEKLRQLAGDIDGALPVAVLNAGVAFLPRTVEVSIRDRRTGERLERVARAASNVPPGRVTANAADQLWRDFDVPQPVRPLAAAVLRDIAGWSFEEIAAALHALPRHPIRVNPAGETYRELSAVRALVAKGRRDGYRLGAFPWAHQTASRRRPGALQPATFAPMALERWKAQKTTCSWSPICDPSPTPLEEISAALEAHLAAEANGDDPVVPIDRIEALLDEVGGRPDLAHYVAQRIFGP